MYQFILGEDIRIGEQLTIRKDDGKVYRVRPGDGWHIISLVDAKKGQVFTCDPFGKTQGISAG